MPSDRLCVFGCVTTGVTTHRFPNPEIYPERFRKWVELAGDTLKDISDEQIYKSKKVCDKHFLENHKNRNNRLSALAIPVKHIPGSSTIAAMVHFEHNVNIASYTSQEVEVSSPILPLPPRDTDQKASNETESHVDTPGCQSEPIPDNVDSTAPDSPSRSQDVPQETSNENEKPNKIYKIINIDGKIMLAEHPTDDALNIENDVGKDNSNTNELSQNSPKDDVEDNFDLPEFTTSNTNIVVQHMSKLNGCDMSNKIYTTKKDLESSKKGFAMVMIALAKYTAVKKKLEELQNKVNILEKELSQKSINEKRLTSQLQKTKMSKNRELCDLIYLQDRLSKTFSDAQLSLIKYPKNTKNMVKWTDKDLEKAAFLKQIISPKAYLYLKYQMKFPLPCLKTLRNWMIEKNIDVTPTNKENSAKSSNDKTTASNMGMNTVEVPLANTGNVQISFVGAASTQNIKMNPNIMQTNYENSANMSNDCMTTQHINSQYVNSETVQAVNVIIGNIQNNYAVSGELQPTFEDANTGEQFVYYVNDNNINNETTPLEEVVIQTSQVTPQKRNMTNMKLKCRLCMKPFETEQEVRQHVSIHYLNAFQTTYLDAEKPFKCEFCSEVLKFRAVLISHHRHHLGIVQFACWHPGCTYVGKSRDALKHHVERHGPRSLACPECGARFVRRRHLRSHRARLHADRTNRRCPLCGRLCRSHFTYRQHLRSHTRPPRFKCPEQGCTEAFYSQISLSTHRLTHAGAEAAYSCPHCPLAVYTQEWQLKKHLHRHEVQKFNNCIKCQRIFHDYGEYFMHCMQQHSVPKHICACTQRFTSKKKLKEHMSQCEVALSTNQDQEGGNPQNVSVEDENGQQESTKKRKRKKPINEDVNPTSEREQGNLPSASMEGDNSYQEVSCAKKRQKVDNENGDPRVVEAPTSETEIKQTCISDEKRFILPERTYRRKLVVLDQQPHLTTSQILSQENVSPVPLQTCQKALDVSEQDIENVDENSATNIQHLAEIAPNTIEYEGSKNILILNEENQQSTNIQQRSMPLIDQLDEQAAQDNTPQLQTSTITEIRREITLPQNVQKEKLMVVPKSLPVVALGKPVKILRKVRILPQSSLKILQEKMSLQKR